MCRRKRRQSPNLATVAVFGDSLQCGQVVGCRDNDVRRFARARKHYYNRRYGEKQRHFSANATYLLLLQSNVR